MREYRDKNKGQGEGKKNRNVERKLNIEERLGLRLKKKEAQRVFYLESHLPNKDGSKDVVGNSKKKSLL